MFKLGEKLKNCALCYDKGEISSGVNKEKVSDHIQRVVPVDINPERIWYDIEEDKCFSEYQYTVPRNADKEQNFFMPQGGRYTKTARLIPRRLQPGRSRDGTNPPTL